MKEISVVSGKGGTGKTVISASLARLISPMVVIDCDVDASNLHLILKPKVKQERPYVGTKVPKVDKSICTECNICGEHCRFGAIENGVVDEWSCDHCGLCSLVCPENAIKMVPEKNGNIYMGETELGPMIYGELLPGSENSGKMVSEIRRMARDICKETGIELILADGPPGIGCPVISTLTGSNGAIVVTEPTPSGLQDMERLIELLKHFRIPAVLAINKWDLSKRRSLEIEEKAKSAGIKYVVKIPFEESVIECMKKGLDPVSGKITSVSTPIAELASYVKEQFLS